VEQFFPPVIIEEPVTVFTEILEMITFTCVVEGNPQPTIEWLRDGDIIGNEARQKLEIPQVELEDRGMYQCVARNSEGSVSSLIVVLNIDSKWNHCHLCAMCIACACHVTPTLSVYHVYCMSCDTHTLRIPCVLHVHVM
jgi:hypothetical protein